MRRIIPTFLIENALVSRYFFLSSPSGFFTAWLFFQSFSAGSDPNRFTMPRSRLKIPARIPGQGMKPKPKFNRSSIFLFTKKISICISVFTKSCQFLIWTNNPDLYRVLLGTQTTCGTYGSIFGTICTVYRSGYNRRRLGTMNGTACTHVVRIP